jgi:hypothetical protein
MAGATNKSLDQATEALIDAQTGELERLKEFGIKKADIAAKANEMYANEEVVNAKGQIVNQEKFNDALLELMNEKFTGGMEKKAQTLSGIMSTISGITKNGLATIMGMGSDGTIADDSPLDILKEKALALSEKMQEMQADGTFDKIAKKTAQGIKNVIKYGKQAFDFVKKNKDTIVTITKIAGAVTSVVFVAGKIVKTIRKVKNAIQEVKTVATAVNVLVAANPTVLIIAAIIAALAAVAYLIYTHWDLIKAFFASVKAKAIAIIENIKAKLAAFKEKVVAGVTALREAIVTKVESVKQKISAFKTSVLGFFTSIGTGIKSALKSAFQWVEDKIDAVKSAATWVTDKASGVASGIKSAVTGQNANGTQYWKGGRTQINEHGGEVVDLPSGTRIYPSTRSKNMGSSTSVKVNVTIQGNVIGNKEYTDSLGNEVAQKILLALQNT